MSLSGLKLAVTMMRVRKIPKLLKQGKSIDEIVDTLFKDAPKEVKEFAADLIVIAIKAKNGEISTDEAIDRIASKFGMSASEFMVLVKEAVDVLKDYYEE